MTAVVHRAGDLLELATAQVELGVAWDEPGLASEFFELARFRVPLQHLLGDQASDHGKLLPAQRALGHRSPTGRTEDVAFRALVDRDELGHVEANGTFQELLELGDEKRTTHAGFRTETVRLESVESQKFGEAKHEWLRLMGLPDKGILRSGTSLSSSSKARAVFWLVVNKPQARRA